MRGEVPEGEHVVPLGQGAARARGHRRDARRLRLDGAALRARGRRARGRGVGRGARHADAEAARRGRAARLGGEDRPRRDRAGGAADARLRGRAGGDPRGEGDPRPARARAARHRLRRAVSVLADRGRVHAVGRARRSTRCASCSRSERLASGFGCWLERGESRLTTSATRRPASPCAGSDPRVRVVPVAGVSFRAEALPDASFDPGRRLALVPEPDNEHDPNAVAIWNEERTLQARLRAARRRARARAATSRRSRSGGSTVGSAC